MIKKHFIKELRISRQYKKNMEGEEIKKIQDWLNLWKFIHPAWEYYVTCDGEFGPQTEHAVKAFQRLSGLEPDGVVGPMTFTKLSAPLRNAFELASFSNANIRDYIIYYADQHLKNKPRELRSNEGPWVRSYLDGNEGKPWAWCMGFVQAIMDMAYTSRNKKFTSVIPLSYSCQDVGKSAAKKGYLLRNKDAVSDPSTIKKGDIFLMYSTLKSRYHHTGIVESVEGHLIHTIEGNTNDEGSRDGYEACRRVRDFTAYQTYLKDLRNLKKVTERIDFISLPE